MSTEEMNNDPLGRVVSEQNRQMKGDVIIGIEKTEGGYLLSYRVVFPEISVDEFLAENYFIPATNMNIQFPEAAVSRFVADAVARITS